MVATELDTESAMVQLLIVLMGIVLGLKVNNTHTHIQTIRCMIITLIIITSLSLTSRVVFH